MLYTVDAPVELTKDVQLGALTKGDSEVYFYNLGQSAIWRVDAATGSCLAKYNAFIPSSRRTCTCCRIAVSRLAPGADRHKD